MTAIALVDGDAMTYPAAWVAWQSANSETYINRLEGTGTRFEDDPPEVREDIFEKAKMIFERQFKGMLQEVNASSFKMAIRGMGNYRERLYPNYKKSRKTGKTSPVREYVKMLDQWLVETGVAIPAVGREADDLLRIWANEMDVDDYIICATDKDLRCIPGRHFHIKTKWEDVAEPFDALKMFYGQIMSGDAVDNIPGLARVGEKTAQKWLAGCKTEEDMQEVVLVKYLEKHPLNWYDELVLNGSLIYIQETADSKFEDLLAKWPCMEGMR